MVSGASPMVVAGLGIDSKAFWRYELKGGGGKEGDKYPEKEDRQAMFWNCSGGGDCMHTC